MVLEPEIWVPGVLIATGGISLFLDTSNRAKRFMHLHTHPYLYTCSHMPTSLEVMNHISTQRVLSHLLPLIFLYPFHRENPGSQQHWHINSFVKSCNTSKIVSAWYHPYCYRKPSRLRRAQHLSVVPPSLQSCPQPGGCSHVFMSYLN